MAELIAIDRFQRLFRVTASLDADKSDIRRSNDLVNRMLHSLLTAAQEAAQADARDVIRATDVPVTAGLKECMQAFEELEIEVELESILEQLATLPPLQLDYGDDLRERLPKIAGAVAVAVARTLKELDPGRSKAEPAEWDRVDAILRILL